MKRLLQTFLALGVAQLFTLPAMPAIAQTDGEGWYQVEIIVFALANPAVSNEIWPENGPTYPPRMLALASGDVDGIRPFNLAQLHQLMVYDKMPVDFPPDPVQRQPRFGQMGAQTDVAAATAESPASSSPASSTDATLADLLNPQVPVPFLAVNEDEYFLDKLTRSIRRSSRYRLLLHTGWRQPIPTDDAAWPVLIQAGDRHGDRYEVDGTLSVSRSRFLHVDANLWFTRFAPNPNPRSAATELMTGLDRGTLRSYPELVSAEQGRDDFIPVQSYRMNSSRRMRSATLHYLDNPYFGILIQIENYPN